MNKFWIILFLNILEFEQIWIWTKSSLNKFESKQNQVWTNSNLNKFEFKQIRVWTYLNLKKLDFEHIFWIWTWNSKLNRFRIEQVLIWIVFQNKIFESEHFLFHPIFQNLQKKEKKKKLILIRLAHPERLRALTCKATQQAPARRSPRPWQCLERSLYYNRADRLGPEVPSRCRPMYIKCPKFSFYLEFVPVYLFSIDEFQSVANFTKRRIKIVLGMKLQTSFDYCWLAVRW
jgi:hypothetical protein